MKLKLERPIAFVDIEGTGLDREKDKIVELSICILRPDMSRETKTRRFNPMMPIPAEATAIHGITDEDVKDCPTFDQVAKGILKFIEGCDLAGFGSNAYDFPLLNSEFARCGVVWDYQKHFLIDCGNIMKIMEPRDLTAAVRMYCGREHIGAHGAEADANATVDVFLAQIERYELPDNIPALAVFSNYDRILLDLSGKFTYNDKGEIIFAFGPNRGQPAANHLDFVQWMIERDFPADTKKVCYGLLTGQNAF